MTRQETMKRIEDCKEAVITHLGNYETTSKEEFLQIAKDYAKEARTLKQSLSVKQSI